MLLELSDLLTQYVTGYSRFSVFNDTGIGGAVYMIIVFYIFGYLAARGTTDKPHDVTFNNLFPAVVVVLFLAIMGVSDLLKGIALFIVYYLTIKRNSTMTTNAWLRIVIYITLALGISTFLTREIAFLYLLTVYAVYYIQGNMRKRERAQQKKEAETKAKTTPSKTTLPMPSKGASKTDEKTSTPSKAPLKEEKKNETKTSDKKSIETKNTPKEAKK